MSHFHELQVNTIDRETSEAVKVGFEVPPELENDFHFVAGQYLTIEKEIAGKKFRRSYSICTSPGKGELKVAVKEVSDGLFSAWVNNKLKVGDSLNVFLPEGRFVFEPTSSGKAKTYVSFAAGSGITPVISILQNVLEREPQSTFVLVYGNKTPEQTIFYKDLLALQQAYPERLYIDFVYSRWEEGKSTFNRIQRVFNKKKNKKGEQTKKRQGRIGEDTINYILRDKLKDHAIDGFYLCGPEPMLETVTQVLKKNEVEEEKIHFELFATHKEEDKVEKKVDGKTKVTVILDDEEVSFEMDRKQRVLDAIMEEGLDPPYSCQGGICSSCMAQIVEGEVEMAHNQILTDGEVEDGLVLTCQSHPKTSTLVVDYDEV